VIDEPWYAALAERYGEAYCRTAGYFDEARPFTTPYREVFNLPAGRTVVQFSGAFHPFHEGHLDAVQSALGVLGSEVQVVVHVDHHEYRASKGDCDEERFRTGLNLLERLSQPVLVIEEDRMPDGCSRNFTRLYAELSEGNTAWFLSGGDRANYALTFKDLGRCIIAGRETAAPWREFRRLHDGERLIFVGGDHPASSTALRRRFAEADRG
jgi:nicotinic acid mononucleotide adenylyltransferase